MKPKKVPDYFFLRSMPISDAWLEDLAERLVKWSSEDKNAIVLGAFLTDEKIVWETFGRWCKRSKSLRDAHKFALQVIGTRREVLALKKELDPSMVKFNQMLYDKNWKKVEEWREELKAKHAPEGTNTFTVAYMERFPERIGKEQASLDQARVDQELLDRKE